MNTRDEHAKLWNEMLARSFDPREWFDGEWPLDVDRSCHQEGTLMWVYRKTEAGLWTVGFFTPKGEWVPDTDQPTQTAAAARVHYLNGGGGGADPRVADAARKGFESGRIKESA